MENKQVLEQLGQPFSVAALEWKVGARNREKTRGIALAYVDSRDYIARLNAVLALGWEDAYTFMVVGTRIVCKCELRLHLVGERSIARTGDGDCELEDPNATTGRRRKPSSAPASSSGWEPTCTRCPRSGWSYRTRSTFPTPCRRPCGLRMSAG